MGWKFNPFTGKLDYYDDTTVAAHASTHENDGADEVDVSDLSGDLADAQDPKTHAADHTDGTDDIQNATSGQKGLATAAQITKLDGIDTGADVTGDNAPQTHASSHQSGGGDAIKLDDLAAPDDTTDLDFSTSAHGLVPKGTNVGNFLKDDGTWTAPTAVDSDAIHDNVASEISAITEKASPVSADLVLLEDSEDSNNKKKAQLSNLPSAGETNTASNVGTAGVGVYKQKTGVDLEFKKINAGSSKVTITDDGGNSEVDIDVSESNLTLDNIGGTLGITKGGTGQTSKTNAFDALAPSTTKGDLISHNGSNNVQLAIGTNGYVLVADSGDPAGAQWYPAGSTYQVRETSSPDWTTTNFTTNGAWHDLDCSSIIPTDTTLIHLFVGIKYATANAYMRFRRNGDSGTSGAGLSTQVGGISIYNSIFVVPDSNRIIEYLALNGTFTEIVVTVIGYFRWSIF